jgi:hypothetical protein
MKKKKIFKYVSLCFTLLLFVVTEVSASWEDYEVMKYNFDISTGPRHESNAEVIYNPIEGEFLLLWHTSGPLRNDCDPGDEYECIGNFNSADARRVSPNGELLGDPIQLSPADERDKHRPNPAYNIFTNEYMVAIPFSIPDSPWELYIAKLNNLGEIQSGPQVLQGGGGGEVLLPDIVFNPSRREYLVLYNDRNIFNAKLNNVGFILDENGDVLHGPFPVGNQVGDFTAQRAVYNPMNDTYFVVWEDLRHVEDWMYDNCDVYGAVLDVEGNMIGGEFPVIDDFGTPGDADQRVPVPCYNPDKDEFLIAWRDHRAGVVAGGALIGGFYNPDGTPKGPDFVIIDGPSMDGSIEPYYVEEEQKYFIVWTDNRASTDPEQFYFLSDNPDIYGQWLDDTATPIGDEIPLCIAPEAQYQPHLDYDPVMKRFLISWQDYNAPNDYGVGDITDISSLLPGDKRATLYGIPSFLSGRVVEEGTERPVEDAWVLVIGPSLPALRQTNVGGWFNIQKGFQLNGTYVVMVFRSGYKMAIQTVSYAGEAQEAIVEVNKRQ